MSNRTLSKAQKLAEIVNGETCDNKYVASNAEYIFLGVEPSGINEIAEEILPMLKERNTPYVIVSMLAGKTISLLEETFGPCPIIRIMPNMPASVGCGVSLYTANAYINKEQIDFFHSLMAPSGMLEEIDEQIMTFAAGITGCGPAFAAMFIEALADGAVAVGLPRDKALRYAAGMLKGSAEMILETEAHPGILKDSVCSPGGSTIQGVRTLEKYKFRSAVMNAVIATFEKKF